ncbi:MAG: hydroxymethylglutaryl-CoA reductase, degradative [Candidatus Aenigmarchaeota archaeon ex4484_56]|nr:MAG: hydroxymethylglutaryl-CoA reductase, degradative [Candidatus Aenigmarchaeota archaeon ex4484_56]
METSAISGFSKLSLIEKINIIKEFANLNEEDLKLIEKYQKLPDFTELENNTGPFKIATNFLVNGKDYFVPMEIEEPSVVAAASRGAKLVRTGGGFTGSYIDSGMIGQIQIVKLENIEETKKILSENKEEFLKIANDTDKIITGLGGGATDIEIREIDTKLGKNIVLHLVVNTLDAMGANIVNTMCEAVSNKIRELIDGKIYLRIISNFADKRIVRVGCKIPIDSLSIGDFDGRYVAEGIIYATELAKSDIYRASTHNKGIMNGIDAVALATGNDWRALEAGVHSYAARNGKYASVTDWWIEDKYLNGTIEIPLAIATVGGATNQKKAKLALKILRVKSARELGIVAASVGLSNNLAALSSIISEGIQKGHMRLHKEFVNRSKNNSNERIANM